MCCGVLGDEVVIRFDPSETETLLGKKRTRVFDFSGRTMKGLIYVEAGGIKTDADLKQWLGIGLKYAKSLPKKK